MLRALTLNAPVGQLLRRYQRMTFFAGIALKLENFFKFQCIIHFMPQLSWNVYLESLFPCNPILVNFV